MTDSPIFVAPDIEVTRSWIRSGENTLAVEAVQSVWTRRRSVLVWPLFMAGLLALAIGGGMFSCGGLFLGADDPHWSRKALAMLGIGAALLFAANRVPPYRYIVHVLVGGQAVELYEAETSEQAAAIERAVTAARFGGEAPRPGFIAPSPSDRATGIAG